MNLNHYKRQFEPSSTYKPQPLRPLEEIRADILALEQETDRPLARIMGESTLGGRIE